MYLWRCYLFIILFPSFSLSPSLRPKPVSKGVATTKELTGCFVTGGMNERWNMAQISPNTKHCITKHPHKSAFLVTEAYFWNTTYTAILHCSTNMPCFSPAQLNTGYRVSLSVSPVSSDSRLLWMLMWIILQVRKRRTDVDTRQSDGFYVLQSRHQQKDPAGQNKVNITVCGCASQREKKGGFVTSISFGLDKSSSKRTQWLNHVGYNFWLTIIFPTISQYTKQGSCSFLIQHLNLQTTCFLWQDIKR